MRPSEARTSGASRASQLPAAQDGAPVHHERHRPERTTLYRLVQQHAATFIAEAEAAAGADLPQFVKDEFDAFLANAASRPTAWALRSWFYVAGQDRNRAHGRRRTRESRKSVEKSYMRTSVRGRACLQADDFIG
jgi:hypothetical protein